MAAAVVGVAARVVADAAAAVAARDARNSCAAGASTQSIISPGHHFSGTLKAVLSTLDDRHPCRSTPRKVNAPPIRCSGKELMA
jgi:hypothetical protein